MNTPQYFTRDGRQLSALDALDADGLLKSGVIVRNRMAMLDSAAMIQRQRVVDGHGRPYGLFQPGFRVLADASRVSEQQPDYGYTVTDQQMQLVLDERAAYDRRISTAWMSGRDAGRKGPEGSPCAVRNSAYSNDQGSPGMMRGGMCVPTKTSDARRHRVEVEQPDDDDDGDKIVANSSALHESAPPRHRVDAASIAQQMRDHQDKMADIYNRLDYELSEKWR